MYEDRTDEEILGTDYHAPMLRLLHEDTYEPAPDKISSFRGRGGQLLDYVGHADVTDALLRHDPKWNWEPLAYDDRGLPFIVTDSNGNPRGLWIRLTVHGHSRLGFGSVEPGKHDAVKELIGDAIRNAAMRFGVALSLWSKSEREPAS